MVSPLRLPPPSPSPSLCLTLLSSSIVISPSLLRCCWCVGKCALVLLPSPRRSPWGGTEFQPLLPHPRGEYSWEPDRPQQNLGDSIRSLGPLIPSFPTGFRWKELCKSCFLVSIQRQFHAVRSSLCCARGRTDTGLIDISVGGKGGGGVQRLSLEELQHLVSSVSLCFSFLAWQEGMPFTMSHKGCFL